MNNEKPGMGRLSLHTKEPGMVGSEVALIGNNINAQISLTLLPIKLLYYLMNFPDFETCENMASTCKTLYNAWNRLKAKRVQRFLEKPFIPVDNKLLLTFIRGKTKLDLPSIFLTKVIRQVRRRLQLQNVKELILTVNYKNFEDLNFQEIQSVFPNINLLQLNFEFGMSLEIPSTTKNVFLIIPTLEKLIVRVKMSFFPFKTQENLEKFLEILEDERVELKFDYEGVFFDNFMSLALEILNSGKRKELKMNERTFFSVFYSKLEKSDMMTLTDIYAQQVHSLIYFANDDHSFDDIFLKIGMFTQLEKFHLDLSQSLVDSSISKLIIFDRLTKLHLICNSIQYEVLFILLQIIFPNLTVVRIVSTMEPYSWFVSLLKLTKLEKINLKGTSTKREGLQDLLKAIAEGQFPRLREISLPKLAHPAFYDNSNISDAELVTLCDQLILNRPLMRVKNSPDCCKHIFEIKD